MSAGMLLNKVQTLTSDALRSALCAIGQDVELEVIVSNNLNSKLVRNENCTNSETESFVSFQKQVHEQHKAFVEGLRKDKYWLYKAQHENEANVVRLFVKVSLYFNISGHKKHWTIIPWCHAGGR